MITNPYRNALNSWDGYGDASRYFDGINDGIPYYTSEADQLAVLFTGNNTLSLSAWIKITVGDTSGGFVMGASDDATGNTKGLWFTVNSSGALILNWGDGSSSNFSTSLNTPSDGADLINGWNHIAATFDNSADMIRYINGSQSGTIDSLSTAGSLQITRGPNIGMRNRVSQLGDGFFKGNICDIRVYNTVLTPTEVTELSLGLNVTNGLIGWWKLNEPGDGPTIPIFQDSAGTISLTNGDLTAAALYDPEGPAD